MSTIVGFFVFLLIMLSLAALAIILDWMGKPIRRSFRPRTAGTPAWLLTDEQSASDSPEPLATDASLAALASQAEAAAPTGVSAEAGAVMQAGVVMQSEGAIQVGDVEPQPPEVSGVAPTAAPPATPPSWQPGESIFKLTPRGTPPTIAAVRRRYWKNLSERPASVLFGEPNQILMSIGQAPQRFNPRIGALEDLQLPEEMLRFCWATKRRPTPAWGDQGLDPYASP
ncbi:MAG: hypothetical protein OXE93_05765 [bacterium]|nr:hypothetical protein [bacterium]MCY4163705.1 hypothetical protein [bacterium]MCY4257045.1 hypothetical protein [bacterium]